MMYEPPKRPQGQGSARVQRMFQILTILYDARWSEDGFDHALHGYPHGWMTTGQIARSLKLTSSPHLRGILDELLAQGAITVQAVDWRPNMQAYAWCIADNARYSEKWKAAFDAWLSPEGVLS